MEAKGVAPPRLTLSIWAAQSPLAPKRTRARAVKMLREEKNTFPVPWLLSISLNRLKQKSAFAAAREAIVGGSADYRIEGNKMSCQYIFCENKTLVIHLLWTSHAYFFNIASNNLVFEQTGAGATAQQ